MEETTWYWFNTLRQDKGNHHLTTPRTYVVYAVFYTTVKSIMETSLEISE